MADINELLHDTLRLYGETKCGKSGTPGQLADYGRAYQAVLDHVESLQERNRGLEEELRIVREDRSVCQKHNGMAVLESERLTEQLAQLRGELSQAQTEARNFKTAMEANRDAAMGYQDRALAAEKDLQARKRKLQRAKDRADEGWAVAHANDNILQKTVEELQAREREVGELRKFIQQRGHLIACPILYLYDHRCTCGYDELLAQLNVKAELKERG